MKTETRYYIRILSPVHIGCDEYYEPMGFVVDEQTCTLTAFDPLDYFRSLGRQDRERYAAVSSKGTLVSLLELYGLMKGKRFPGHDVAITRDLVEHYRQTLSMRPHEANTKKVQQELNNFSIARTSYNGHDNQPYIPGSALKGALRTAYLNRLAQEHAVRDDPRDRNNAAQALERNLLLYDRLEHDPFRLLKVSDFMPVSVKTRIVYGVNEKKKPAKFKARGPYQILEVIEPDSIFTGTIKIENRLAAEAEITQPLTEDALYGSIHGFYTREMAREREELGGAGLPVPTPVDPDGGWPIRIGRHSGAESVTIEGHRRIKIMQGRDKPPISSSTGATTFWLAAEARTDYDRAHLQPFGWATLGKLTDELASQFAKLHEAPAKTADPPPSDPDPEARGETAPVVKKVPPAEETWDNAYVSFNAGGGGVVTAKAKDEKRAEIRGKNKAVAIVAEALQKKLFEKPRNVPHARVIVRAVGNEFEIVRIEAMPQ